MQGLMVGWCMQAQEALLEYVRCNVAPAVHTGASLLAALRNTRLLPTGCERRGLHHDAKLP